MLSKGFTLIEMMVVVFIVSIMLGVSALAIRSDGSKTLQSDGNQLVKQVTHAKQELAMRQTAITLQVDRTGWSFLNRTANGLQPTNIAALRAKKWSQTVDTISSPMHTLRDGKILVELDGEPVGSPIDITVVSGVHVLDIKNDAQGQFTAMKPTKAN